jgi:hypothetical protein
LEIEFKEGSILYKLYNLSFNKEIIEYSKVSSDEILKIIKREFIYKSHYDYWDLEDEE